MISSSADADHAGTMPSKVAGFDLGRANLHAEAMLMHGTAAPIVVEGEGINWERWRSTAT